MGLNGFKKDVWINVSTVWQKKGMLAYQCLSDFFKVIFQQSIMEISSISLRQETKKISFKGHKKNIHCTSQKCLEEEFFYGFSIFTLYVDFFWEINHCTGFIYGLVLFS